ncbi:MAG: CDP-alcohol phosphatidyltransferase family protein [Parcubacteria group bacterium]
METVWREDLKRGLVPNSITLGGLFLVPFIILFHYHAYFITSLAILVSAWILDGFDGWWARRTKSCTQIGAFMDPLVDKLFTWSLLVYFWDEIVPAAGILIIAVGVCLTVARIWKMIYGAKKKIKVNILASISGKIKVCVEKSAFTLIILAQIMADRNILPEASGIILIIANCALFGSLFFAAFSLKRQVRELT